MAKLKKINEQWQPSESRDLHIGEIVEITDYMKLVKTGMAVLVDGAGNELPLPGEVFTCPICYKRTETLLAFTSHVGERHSSVSPSISLTEDAPKETGGELDVSARDEAIRQQRISALEKAREAKKALNATK